MAKTCKVDSVTTMGEFRKRYFPKSSSKSNIDIESEPENLAIAMAKKSIKRVRRQLSK